MAADVSSLVRVLSGYKDDQHGHDSEKSTALITRDLLGGSPSKLVSDAQELDLDLQVPCGWEKRLDLKSGKVYLQRCNAQNSISDNNKNSNPTVLQTPNKLQDLNLNFPANKSTGSAGSGAGALSLFDDSSLDLKLVSPSAAYQSVCTLDKVKSALERAETKRRSSAATWHKPPHPPSPSHSSSSSSMNYKNAQEDSNRNHRDVVSSSFLSSSPFAAGCPGCLSYVLIMKNNPKCPRCNTVIPLPLAKKPRIDLNMSI